MTDRRYGLSAPEEASESGPMSAVDEEVEGDSSAAGATGRRHLSATERKLMKKQVSAQVPICKFSFPGATRLLPAIFIKV